MSVMAVSVARNARGVESPVHIVGVGVGRSAEYLLGGGVHRREPPGAAGDERTVDEQVTGAIGCYRHPRLPTFAVIGHLSDAMERTIAAG